jgi:hypothetical protein
MWRSLVAHLTGGQGVAGSNPVIPTHIAAGQRPFAGSVSGLFRGRTLVTLPPHGGLFLRLLTRQPATLPAVNPSNESPASPPEDGEGGPESDEYHNPHDASVIKGVPVGLYLPASDARQPECRG